MMRFSFVDGVALATHGSQPPSDAEWSAWLEGLRAHDTRARWLIVYSLGGGPGGKQRSALSELLQEMKQMPETLVFSDSVALRGIVTAVNWFLPEKRRASTFPLQALPDALRDKGLSAELCQAIEARIKSDMASIDPAQRSG